MGLTSASFLVVLVVLAVAAPAAAVTGWNRVGRRSPVVRWTSRFSLLVGVQVIGCLLLAVVLNDLNQFYPSWGELFGGTARLTTTAAHTGAFDRTLPTTPAVGTEPHSRIVTVTVPVAGRNASIPAEVYLPAAYFEPQYAQRQFPVVELLDGFPGGPQSWLRPQSMDVQRVLDSEFASGRADPFVAVMPTQNFQGTHDGECINAVGGTQVETTLVQNVRAVMYHDFRVGLGAGSWSAIGYSTGGFCAVNITMRHPGLFGSAVSIDGYVRPYLDLTTGPLFGTDVAYRHANDPLWRVQHGQDPPVSVLLTYSGGDPSPRYQAYKFGEAVHDPLRLSFLHMPGGGHNFATFRAQEPVAFDWVSRHLISTPAPAVSIRGHIPVRILPRRPAAEIALRR